MRILIIRILTQVLPLLLCCGLKMTYATVITTPIGLDVGDSYRLAFVTSISRDATSDDIADYNAFVTAVANSQPDLSNLGTNWNAIASTDLVSAAENTGTQQSGPTIPIVLLDGSTLVARSSSDLWSGDIINPININEMGEVFEPDRVWTGTSPFGSVSFAGGSLSGELCGGPAAGPTDVCSTYGSALYSSSPWVQAGVARIEDEYPFYALSDTLIVLPAVPVPVPAAIWLFISGIIVLVVKGKFGNFGGTMNFPV